MTAPYQHGAAGGVLVGRGVISRSGGIFGLCMTAVSQALIALIIVASASK